MQCTVKYFLWHGSLSNVKIIQIRILHVWQELPLKMYKFIHSFMHSRIQTCHVETKKCSDVRIIQISILYVWLGYWQYIYAFMNSSISYWDKEMFWCGIEISLRIVLGICSSKYICSRKFQISTTCTAWSIEIVPRGGPPL